VNARVLVLNRNWFPVNVIDALDAVHKVFKGRAVCLDTETGATYDFDKWLDNWDDAAKLAKLEAGRMAGAGRAFLVLPEVIVCTEYKGFGYKVNMRHRPSFSRRNLFIRDRNTCQFCGKKFRTEELTMDHVVPKSKGGRVTWKNIVLACTTCNNKKGGRYLKDSGMRLIRQPFEPKAGDLVLGPVERLKMRLGRNVPKTWEQFLGRLYWLTELEHD
jgi:hypothetical protein